MSGRRAGLLGAAWLSLVGCGGAGSSASLTSDGHTWLLSLPSTEAGTGWSDLSMRVTTELDGSPAEGLDVVVEVAMPSMGHGSSEPATTEEMGDGDYLVSAHFEMAGAWQLSGTLADSERSETFVVDLDVFAD